MISVLFRHSDWKEASSFHASRSMKWATFLLSLREALETGVGRPCLTIYKFPDTKYWRVDNDAKAFRRLRLRRDPLRMQC